VCVALPDVIRGADQVSVKCADGMRIALLSPDASVPIELRAACSLGTMLPKRNRGLNLDLAENGAPRLPPRPASAHRAPAVMDLPEAHQVLVLLGPPPYPH